MKEINSIQNPLVKQIGLLQSKSRERRKTGLFVIEGLREISLALKTGYHLKKLLVNETIYQSKEVPIAPSFLKNAGLIRVSKEVYQKLAYRESTEGIMAIAESKPHNLKNIKLESDTPLLLVAEAPEKPGNLGALLRTADAAGVDAVLIANPKTDLYNPNIIRSSVGSIFANQIITGTTNEIISFLKEHNIAIYAAELEASVSYTTIDYTKATAIVVGTEATGLEKIWLENATRNIIIPMQGKIDSMNVSVAAAILIFEARRQRGFIPQRIEKEQL